MARCGCTKKLEDTGRDPTPGVMTYNAATGNIEQVLKCEGHTFLAIWKPLDAQRQIMKMHGPNQTMVTSVMKGKTKVKIAHCPFCTWEGQKHRLNLHNSHAECKGKPNKKLMCYPNLDMKNQKVFIDRVLNAETADDIVQAVRSIVPIKKEERKPRGTGKRAGTGGDTRPRKKVASTSRVVVVPPQTDDEEGGDSDGEEEEEEDSTDDESPEPAVSAERVEPSDDRLHPPLALAGTHIGIEREAPIPTRAVNNLAEPRAVGITDILRGQQVSSRREDDAGQPGHDMDYDSVLPQSGGLEAERLKFVQELRETVDRKYGPEIARTRAPEPVETTALYILLQHGLITTDELQNLTSEDYLEQLVKDAVGDGNNVERWKRAIGGYVCHSNWDPQVLCRCRELAALAGQDWQGGFESWQDELQATWEFVQREARSESGSGVEQRRPLKSSQIVRRSTTRSYRNSIGRSLSSGRV